METLDNELQTLNNVENEANSAGKELEVIVKKLTVINADTRAAFVDIKQMIKEKPSLESLNKEVLTMINTGINQAKTFIDTLSEPINEQLEEVLVSISDDFHDSEDKINKFTNDLQKVNQDIEAAKINSKKFTNAVKNMKNHLNACYLISTNLKIDAEKLKAKLEKSQDLPRMKASIKNFEVQVVDLETKIKGKLYYLKVLAFSFEGIQGQISNIKSEFSEMKLNKLNDRITSIKEQVLETKQMVDDFRETAESYKELFKMVQLGSANTANVKNDAAEFAKLKRDSNNLKEKAFKEQIKLKKVTTAAVQSTRLGLENSQIKLNKLNHKRANLEHLISELTQKLIDIQ